MTKKPVYKFSQTVCCGAIDKGQNIDPHDEEMDHLRKYYMRRDDLQHLIQ